MSKRTILIYSGILFAGAAYLLWRDSKNIIFQNSPQIDTSGSELPAPSLLSRIGKTMSDIVNTLSNNGLNLIKALESFSALPYKDARGWSIGYGHYMGPSPTLNYVTTDQAEKLLYSDTEKAQAIVRALVLVPLSQNQFDALTSFIYNVGVGAFGKSTLLRVLNDGNYQAASDQFQQWNKEHLPDGEFVVSPSLVARRETEQQLFMT